MFLQDHKQRQAIEASIGEMDKEVEALRQFERKIEELDEEIARGQKNLEKLAQERAKVSQKIATLVNDPDMALKAIAKLEEEGDAAEASIKRHQRALDLLHVQRREMAIDYAERRERARIKWTSIAEPYVDQMIAQELEGLEGLLTALAIKSQCLSPFEPLVNDFEISRVRVMANIVYQHILKRLPEQKPELSADPLFSRLKRVSPTGLPDIPDNLKLLGRRKAKASVQAERARLLGQAAA